ncbi:MAG: hypothetical protein JWN00_1444 [Actinomycetia bacterium]|nr:hypothetical protein [Actinomycetes bacterium]
MTGLLGRPTHAQGAGRVSEDDHRTPPVAVRERSRVSSATRWADPRSQPSRVISGHRRPQLTGRRVTTRDVTTGTRSTRQEHPPTGST